MDLSDRLSVLVADDNPAARAQIAQILEELGHDVTAVDDGAQAVSALDTLRFDLVILDFEMPGVRGDEVSRHAAAERMPVIGLSSAGAGRDQWGDAPIGEWMAKPVDARALAEAVRGATAGDTAGAAAAAPIDLAHLATYTDGDTVLERELATLFAGSCDRYLDQMAGAGDTHQWRDAAHGLKGAARGIGATELARLAAFAETLLGHAAEKRRGEVLAEMRAAAEDVRAFFDAHLGES